MLSPASRFTQLQKIAVFLLTLGADKTREILVDLDLDTLDQINRTLADLGPVTTREKAAVMIEFGDLFFKGTPLSSKLPESAGSSPVREPAPQPHTPAAQPAEPPPPTGGLAPAQAAARALEHLRHHVDPRQIDWGRAGYDFGEGFRGSGGGRGR